MKKLVVVVLAFCAMLFASVSQAQDSNIISVLKAKIKVSPRYLGVAWPKNLDHLTTEFLMHTFPEAFFPVSIAHSSTGTFTAVKDLGQSLHILQELRFIGREKSKEYKLFTCSGGRFDPKYNTWDIDENVKSYLSGNISLSKAIFILWQWFYDECETFDELAETILGDCDLFTKEDFAQDLNRINASIPDSLKAVIAENLEAERNHQIFLARKADSPYMGFVAAQALVENRKI